MEPELAAATQVTPSTNLQVLDLLKTQFTYQSQIRSLHLDAFWSPRHHLPLGGRSSQTKKIVTVHDLTFVDVPQTMRLSRRLVEKCLLPPSIHQADAIITVSQFSASRIRHYFPETASKIHVVPLGVDHMERSHHTTDYMLFVGSLEPRKNITQLLRAFASLNNQTRATRLLMVSGHNWKYDPTDLIRELGIEDRVDMLSSVDDNRLSKLYASCRFVVVPSHYEGFGLPVLEAYSHGKAVVITPQGALMETGGPEAIVCDGFDSEAIAKALEFALNNPEDLLQRGMQAHSRTRTQSWDDVANRTLQIIEQTVS